MNIKYFSFFLVIGIGIYSFMPIHQSKEEKTLRVFFMKDFNGDSINLSTSASNNLSLRVTGQQSLEDSSQLVYLNMTPQDSVVTIRDIEHQYTWSAKYDMGYDYLFIYYKAPKYTFRFSNKILMQEE